MPANLNADRSVFNNVRFLGNQDTLLVNNYRSYTVNSYVEGTVDFNAGATSNSNRHQLTDAQAGTYTPQKYLAGSDGWNPI